MTSFNLKHFFNFILKMTEYSTVYVKYKNNSAVETAGEKRIRPLETVGQLITAYKPSVAPRFFYTFYFLYTHSSLAFHYLDQGSKF